MPITHFPHGISSFGAPVLGSAPVTGNVYWVDSGHGSASNAGDGSFEDPWTTIDYAIGQCTANHGDVIYVKPGHTETIAAAGGITVDVAGISIIGLGNGNLRPTITWSAAASSCLITAANVLLKNIRTTISIDEVVSMFAVSAAGVTFDAVDFIEYGAKGATGQAIQFLLTTAAADDLTIMNCRHKQGTAATANQIWIQLVGTDNTRIINNYFDILAKAATASLLVSGSTAVVDCEIAYNVMAWRGATITGIINLVTTSSGFIHHNVGIGGAAVLLAAAYVGDACAFAENYVSNTVGTTSGALAPALDTVN